MGELGEYKLMEVRSEHERFKDNDGLFVIIKEHGSLISGCKLDEDGNPRLRDNGAYYITYFSSGSRAITRTNNTMLL